MDNERRFPCPSTKRRCVESECHIFLCVRRRAEAEHASRVYFETEDRRKAVLVDDDTA
jgi:hypothetical protein